MCYCTCVSQIYRMLFNPSTVIHITSGTTTTSQLTIYNLHIKLVLVSLGNISYNNSMENIHEYIHVYVCVCVCKLLNYFLTIPGSTSHSPVNMSHGLQLPEMIGLIVGVLVVIVTVTIALVAVLVVILSTFITKIKRNVLIPYIFFIRSS